MSKEASGEVDRRVESPIDWSRSGGWPARLLRMVWGLRRRRFLVQALLDSVAWALGLTLATALRYDLDFTRIGDQRALIALAIVAQVAVGRVAGLYIGRWQFGSFEELAAVTRGILAVTALVFVIEQWVVDLGPIPRSAILGGGVIAFVLMGASRYTWRLAVERALRPGGEEAERLIVFGAGDAGTQAIDALLRQPSSRYLPVALLDDDPSRRSLRIRGIRVMGGRADLAEVSSREQATTMLIAIPTADGTLIGELADAAKCAGLAVKVLPPVHELLASKVNVGDIRDLTETDLLGRHQVEIDVTTAAQFLTGRRVLVTGAGGSIGAELCRQVHSYAPSELIMLDRDETALHAVQLSIEGRALLDSRHLVLADVRDRGTISSVFEERQPEVVFHAAALKHLPLLESYPGEAGKTNVWGTQNVLDAARATGVERFVNISTDKAADPISVLGYSKRLAERLTAYAARLGEGVFLSVRFGNVLGTRGSVVPTFRDQIKAGNPITVTHPEITRFFMTVEEAVRLVIQAGAVGRAGEVLVLDMGKPVRIGDVARRLADQAEQPVAIHYTGLRPGEKLHEVLLGEGEIDDRPNHPLISEVPVPPLDPRALDGLDPALVGDPARDTLRRLWRETERAARSAWAPRREPVVEPR